MIGMPSIDVGKNLDLLKDSDPQKRRAAVEALGRNMIKAAAPLMLDLLKNEKVVEVRRATVISLSLLGGNGILPILLDIIKNDSDLETRRNAAGGLRFMGDKIKSKDIIPLLLEEEDENISNVLSGTIIYLKEKGILPELLALYQAETNKKLKACLLEIIGSFDTPESKLLLTACAEPDVDDDLRLIATMAMSKIDDVSFIPILYKVYTEDPIQEIKDSAYKTLDELSIALHYHSVGHMVKDYLEKAEEKKKAKAK